MVFSSITFMTLFLPIVLAVNLILPRLLRNTWLLITSLLFYAWGEPFFVLVMLGSITMNYVFGLFLERFRDRAVAAKWILGLSVAANLGLLGVYKYANFAVANINIVLGALHLAPLQVDHIPLPIGISFFTFQAMSYVIDLYRREVPVQRNPLALGLYVSLFPQLIAGPIVRYQDVAAQIIKRRITPEGFAYGIRRFTLGMGKKVLIANTLAGPCDKLFALPPDQLTPELAWLAVICYTGQIYFDFSGYSDMAIGMGHMLGFRFLENFQWPYIARNIREFWRRWHISLSTWFRDYLYIPLGGSRGNAARTAFNLFLVFFLCGLWHGASWTFAVWGMYHGLFLALERTAFGGWQQRWPRAAQHAYTLLVVMAGWVFFRAETFTQALLFFRCMAGWAGENSFIHQNALGLYLTPEVALALPAAVIGATPALPWLQARMAFTAKRMPGGAGQMLEGALAGTGSLICLGMLVLCVMLLASQTHNPFIYFRF